MPQRSKRRKTGEEEQAEQEDDAPRKTRRFGEQQPSSDRIGGRSGANGLGEPLTALQFIATSTKDGVLD